MADGAESLARPIESLGAAPISEDAEVADPVQPSIGRSASIGAPTAAMASRGRSRVQWNLCQWNLCSTNSHGPPRLT